MPRDTDQFVSRAFRESVHEVVKHRVSGDDLGLRPIQRAQRAAQQQSFPDGADFRLRNTVGAAQDIALSKRFREQFVPAGLTAEHPAADASKVRIIYLG